VLEFDLLLCVFEGKFHKADTELFHEVTRRGKTCLFVRNKHDTLWQDDKELADLEQGSGGQRRRQVGGPHPVFFTSCRLNTGLGNSSRPSRPSSNRPSRSGGCGPPRRTARSSWRKKKDCVTSG
jgi:predicted GTPase